MASTGSTAAVKPPEGPLQASSGPTRLKITHRAAASTVVDRQVFLTNRDLTNTANMREMTIKARPRNTTNNYSPKQQEFINWTREMGYADGETVTEAKMMSFLTDRVVHRPLRKARKRKNAVTVVDEGSGQPIQVLKWGSVRT